VFEGEQMIAALNAAGLDLATLGNHEFDFGDDICTVQRFYELLPITSALPDESKTAAAIASFESRLSTALGETVGATRVPLDGVSLHLRASETNLGNFFADAIRADANADIAITNAGSIRGDRMFPAGLLTRRTLVEIHSFGNVVCVHGLPGRVVLQALEHGVSSLAVSDGRFPQVSGLTMIVDRKAPAGSRVRDVKVSRRESRNGASGRGPNHASLNQRRRAGHTPAGNQARSRSRRSRSSIVSTS